VVKRLCFWSFARENPRTSGRCWTFTGPYIAAIHGSAPPPSATCGPGATFGELKGREVVERVPDRDEDRALRAVSPCSTPRRARWSGSRADRLSFLQGMLTQDVEGLPWDRRRTRRCSPRRGDGRGCASGEALGRSACC
jgi:hypothetical protein